MIEQLPNQVESGGLNPTSPLQFTVRQIPSFQTYEWLLKKHYAHRIPSISYAFGLYDANSILQGVCTYGMCPGKEVSNLCGDEYKSNVQELNRVIKNDGLPQNTQSFFIAQTFRMLPRPMVVVSYADPNQNHHGYVYQALNFIYTGTSRSGRTYIYNDQEWHERHINNGEFFAPLKLPFDTSKTIMDNFIAVGGQVKKDKPKHRYVIFIGNKEQKAKLKDVFKWESHPYPKGDNQRYDSSYQPDTQALLI